jgi:hypothetical protein
MLQHFSYNWANRFTIRVPYLISVDFLFFFASHSSQQTMKYFSTWINAKLDTSDHGLLHALEGPEAFSNGLIGIHNALVKCILIFIWSWKQSGGGGVICHTDKYLEDWGRADVGGCTSKTVCGRVLIWTFFFFLYVGNSYLKIFKIIKYIMNIYVYLQITFCARMIELYASVQESEFCLPLKIYISRLQNKQPSSSVWKTFFQPQIKNFRI